MRRRCRALEPRMSSFPPVAPLLPKRRRRPIRRCPRDCAAALRISKMRTLSSGIEVSHREVAGHIDPVEGETAERSNLRGCRCAFEPTRRTPRIGVGDRYDPVMDCILVDINEHCEIRALEGQLRAPKVVPHLPARRFIESIDPFRGLFVQLCQHCAERIRGFICHGGMPDKVIVVRKNYPRLELPFKLHGLFQQPAL